MIETINSELHVNVPDGFEVLTAEELKALYLDQNPNRWGMQDKNRHLTAAIFFHASNPILAAIADVKSIADNTQKQLQKGLASYGYEQGNSFMSEVAGLKAAGFTYHYVNHETPTEGKVVVFKHGKTCYTLYWYSRTGNETESEQLFREFCDGIRLD